VLLLGFPLVGLVVAAVVVALGETGSAATPATPALVVPYIARDGMAPPPPTPTPTPVAQIDYGPPRSLTLASARIPASAYIEARHTHDVGGRETFEDPSRPQYIAWYHRFSTMGRGGQNTIMAAHINYAGYGNGPFRYLTSARVGDQLSIRMDSGHVLTFTVKSVEVIKLTAIDMDAIVYAPVAANRERITLISCGGTFVPYSGGGGAYDSRVFLVAERILD